MVTELDLFLEKYGNVLVKQPRVPIDWMADPRRRNNTWEPWLNPEMTTYLYGYNAASGLSTWTIFIHIGMTLLIVTLKLFN